MKHQLCSGTGLVVSYLALEQWLKINRYDTPLFGLESELNKALLNSKYNMYELKGKIAITGNNTVFTLNNRTVMTCHIK